MTENSTRILSQVAASMANFGAPMLLDKKDWKEAERMAEDGMLQRHQPVFKSYGYTLTDAGVEAYRKAFPPEPSQPPVKAWGDHPPKTRKGRIGFIKRQAKPLEDAYWLEVGDDDGVESMTLSESALDAKLKELDYDRHDEDDYDRIRFGREDNDDVMPTCSVTGKLLHGSWSSEPRSLAYGLEGFAWRRAERFQMEDRDWSEAWGYIDRLNASDRQEAKLIRLIVDSCFLDPAKTNDTGLICPGGGSQDDYAELIALFDFMSAEER